MLRRGILKARVSPPSRRSRCVIALSEMAIGGLAHPDILGGGDGRTRINGE